MTASTPVASGSGISPTPRLAFPALLLANAVLAFGPTLVRIADVGPVAAGFWRLTLALPVLFLLAAPGLRRARLRPVHYGMIAIAGLLFAGDLAAWHLGIHHTKIANATLFGNASALALPLWGLIVLRQKLRGVQMVTLAIAFVGAAVLMGGSYEASPLYLRGDLLCVLAGLFYTAYLLVMQDARRRLDSWATLFLASLAGALPLLLFALWLGETVMPVNWWPVIAVALSSQLVGQGLLTYAIGWFSPLVLGLSLLVQPVIGALLGWALFGEVVTMTDALGGMLVGAALILVRLPARA
ncbi:MAG: DMT family transporter [Sphingobium sp.]